MGRRSRRSSVNRKEGLKNKARELATLCGVDVCLVGVAPDGSCFSWPDDISEVDRIAKRYLDAVGGSSNDGGGTKRKRAAAAAGETASCRSLVAPRPKKRTKGSQRGKAVDTREVQELRTEGQGSDSSGVRVAGSPDLHLAFAPAMALHPDDITGADIEWLTIPPLAHSPSSAMLSCPAAAELGSDSGIMDPLGMAAAGLYDDDMEDISLLLSPCWELLHASL